MALDLEYDIDDAAYGSFHDYISACMELPFFFNSRMMLNNMDRTRMNSSIRTFERFVIQGETRGVCTMVDLKNIDAQNLPFCWTCRLGRR